MNEAKLIVRGLVPCFLAISAALLLNASMCGSAITLAASYVIAPWQSHIFMFFKLITAGFIVISLRSDITACCFNLQGENRIYLKTINGYENGEVFGY